MLTLLLLRHAKAVPHGRGDDASRPLTEKGAADAKALGAHVAEIGLVPDLALVSDAVRTRQTFDKLAEGVGVTIPSRFEHSLYNASETRIRDLLKRVAADVRTLLVIGHNPGMADAAVRLACDGDPNDLCRLRSRFPPCALAVIGFDRDDWRDARASGGRLDLLLMPDDVPPPG